MASRFGTRLNYTDFTEDEFVQIWERHCARAGYTCTRKVTLVVARRLVRCRGRKGFGNARTMRQIFDQAAAQADARFVTDGKLEIIVTDIIGLLPTRESNPVLAVLLDKLDAMTGLEEVKRFIYTKVQMAKTNYELELKGEAVDLLTLNCLFLGIVSFISSLLFSALTLHRTSRHWKDDRRRDFRQDPQGAPAPLQRRPRLQEGQRLYWG